MIKIIIKKGIKIEARIIKIDLFDRGIIDLISNLFGRLCADLHYDKPSFFFDLINCYSYKKFVHYKIRIDLKYHENFPDDQIFIDFMMIIKMKYQANNFKENIFRKKFDFNFHNFLLEDQE